MRIRVLALSAAAASILIAASPMVSTSMSTDNGGAKLAIDAYSDGGGVLIINQAGDTKFDNSAMNKLVFKYGDAAKAANTTIRNQVNVLSTTSTTVEKADAGSKLELAKVAINPPVNGTECDDGKPQTIADIWTNGLCGGSNVEGLSCDDQNTLTFADKYTAGVCAGVVDGTTCNDNNSLTFADKYTSGVCAGVVDGTSCDDQNTLTFADKYTSGVCAGVVDGTSCSDNNSLTFFDKYTSGVCAGIANGTSCNDLVAYTYADKYTSGICGGTIALSCKDVKTLTATTSSGAYTIKPTGSAEFSVYCDMVTDGGGWTLALKVTGASPGTLLNGKDTNSWTNGTVTGTATDTSSIAAVGQAYSAVSFNSVMIRGLADSTKRLSWQHPTTYANLRTVVNAKVSIRDGALIGGNIKSLAYRSGCGTGVTPPNIYYGFYVEDAAGLANALLGKSMNAWTAAIIGYGSTYYASGYNVAGGVGAVGHQPYTANAWDMNRHIHGYGDGCTPAEWNANYNGTQSFVGHGVFVK